MILGYFEDGSDLISMAMKYLPPVLTAAFVAALASALMSTSDSSMLAGATITDETFATVPPDVMCPQERLSS